MGTNLADFIRKSHRVLKDKGWVQVAKVHSRIEYSHSQKGGGKMKDDVLTQKSEAI